MVFETPVAHHSRGCIKAQVNHQTSTRTRRKHLRQRARNHRKPRNRKERPQTIKLINCLPGEPRNQFISLGHRDKRHNSEAQKNNRQRPITGSPAQNLRRDPTAYAPEDEPDRVPRTEARKDKILALARPRVDVSQGADSRRDGGRAAEPQGAVQDVEGDAVAREAGADGEEPEDAHGADQQGPAAEGVGEAAEEEEEGAGGEAVVGLLVTEGVVDIGHVVM